MPELQEPSSQGASSSSPRHYAKLLSNRASRSPTRAFASGQLSCHSDPLFARLSPLPDDMEPFYDKVLSIEGNIFEPCTVS